MTSHYAEAAARAELARLAATGPGSRAQATFRAAAALGQLVGGGELAHDETRDALLDAATACGLAEREARGHVLRGLKRGARTPRIAPPERGTSMTRIRAPRHMPTEPRKYPPDPPIDALWRATIPVTHDAQASAWLVARGLCAEATELWDLARVIPTDAALPPWARSRAGTWIESGHRLLFPLFDSDGARRSVRVRSLVPADNVPKSLAPAGFTTCGLVLADPLGVQILAGIDAPWWTPRVVIEEGEPDFLTRASLQPEENEQGPAVFGIESGAWTQAIADRIPDGAIVVIETHHDEAGDRYASDIARTLQARCSVHRSKKLEPSK